MDGWCYQVRNVNGRLYAVRLKEQCFRAYLFKVLSLRCMQGRPMKAEGTEGGTAGSGKLLEADFVGYLLLSGGD